MQSSIFLAICSFKAINSLKSDTFCLCFQAFLLEKTLFFFFLRTAFPALPAHEPQGSQKQILGGGCACCIVSGNTECVCTCRHSHCLMQCRGGAEQCAHMYVTAPAALIYVSLYGRRGGGGVGSREALRVRGLAAYPGNEVIVAWSGPPPTLSTFPRTGPAPSQRHPSTAAR